MLPPHPPRRAPPPPPLHPPRHRKILGRPRQIMIPALQLLQILIINEPLLPQMLKEVEIRPARPQTRPHEVVPRNMRHARPPRRPPVTRALEAEVGAHGTRDAARRLLAPEVTEAVDQPFVVVVRDVAAGQEPEGALEEGPRGRDRVADFEHAVDVFEEVDALEEGGLFGGYAGFGRRRGVRVVVEGGRVLGGRRGLVDAGGSHGGAAGREGAGRVGGSGDRFERLRVSGLGAREGAGVGVGARG